MKPHKARVLSMQALFQREFNERTVEELSCFDWIDYRPAQAEMKMAVAIIEGVLQNFEEIDDIIVHYSLNWDIKRISYVNRAILRISIFQMMQKKYPMKVIIDEAIKLAKDYAEDEAGRFVNGILDAYWSRIKEKEYKNESR